MNERNYVLNGVPSDEFHVTYVDKLQAENAKLKAERDTAIEENSSLTSSVFQYGIENTKLQAEIGRLRKALEEIAESDELAQHIAKQALKQEKQNGQWR